MLHRLTLTIAILGLAVTLVARDFGSEARGLLDDDSCSGLPAKVALLFLATGDLHTEKIWTSWLSSVAFSAPVRVLCEEKVAACLSQERGRKADSVYSRQFLYTIYVSTPTNFPGFPDGSIFRGREVARSSKQEPVPRSQDMKAIKQLLKVSLADSSVQRFQLLHHGAIPLQHAALTYVHLLSRTSSNGFHKVDAHETYRLFDPGAFTLHEWDAVKRSIHKQEEIFSLIRRDAQWVVEDKSLLHLFMRSCMLRNTADCTYLELYIGTVISRKLNGVRVAEERGNINDTSNTYSPPTKADKRSMRDKGLFDISSRVANASECLQVYLKQARWRFVDTRTHKCLPEREYEGVEVRAADVAIFTMEYDPRYVGKLYGLLRSLQLFAKLSWSQSEAHTSSPLSINKNGKDSVEEENVAPAHGTASSTKPDHLSSNSPQQQGALKVGDQFESARNAHVYEAGSHSKQAEAAPGRPSAGSAALQLEAKYLEGSGDAAEMFSNNDTGDVMDLDPQAEHVRPVRSGIAKITTEKSYIYEARSKTKGQLLK